MPRQLFSDALAGFVLCCRGCLFVSENNVTLGYLKKDLNFTGWVMVRQLAMDPLCRRDDAY
jgi:hypothetical protein